MRFVVSVAIAVALADSAALAVEASVAKLVVNVFSAVVALETSLAKAVELVDVLASTYVFTDFTLGYFVSDAPSVVTLVLLLAKSSFNKSALVLLVTSVAKLVDKVASATVLALVSAVKLPAITFSAVVALTISAVKLLVKIAST